MSETNTNPFGFIQSEGIKLIKGLVPNWVPTDLCHPHAHSFTGLIELIMNIQPGEQIMVRGSGISDLWHHAIFMGELFIEAASD